jgi:glycosyltransferase involved in cell wall biosynthesis
MGYKRIDLIVEAFNWLGWRLIVTGDGPERERLQARSLENIEFLGYVSDAKRTQLMAKTRAVVVAALEDYGLVPLEANASGTPVVGYGVGGILDTQVPGQTAVFFDRQTPEALQTALLEAKETEWDYRTIRDRAINEFSEDAFFEKVDRVIQEACCL